MTPEQYAEILASLPRRGRPRAQDAPKTASAPLVRRAKRQTKLRPDQPKEAVILRDVRRWASKQEGLVLERNSRGTAQRGDRWVAFGLGDRGVADLVGAVAPHGRMVALELKSAIGAVSREQKAWLKRINAVGGYGVVVRSLEGAQIAIERARRGERVTDIDPERLTARR